MEKKEIQSAGVSRQLGQRSRFGDSDTEAKERVSTILIVLLVYKVVSFMCRL
jgi:hypothetical protein